MKLAYGSVPVKALNINYFEQDTNDCTMIESDLQAGKTGVVKGKKITGTGKSFEFAYYGRISTNVQGYVPTLVNIVEIASTDYPIKSLIGFDKMIDTDFTTEQTIGIATIDNIEYPIVLNIQNNILTFKCEKKISLQFFYGKDNYV